MDELAGFDDSGSNTSRIPECLDSRRISRQVAGRQGGLIVFASYVKYARRTGVCPHHRFLCGPALYWENKLAFFTPKGVKIPVAASAFPDELYQAPRSWAEKAYPNLVHFNRLDKGGHFAAWEQPKHLTEELRKGLRSVRA